MTKNNLRLAIAAASLLSIIGYFVITSDSGVQVNENLTYSDQASRNSQNSQGYGNNGYNSNSDDSQEINTINDFYFALNQAMQLSEIQARIAKVTLLLTELSERHNINDSLEWLSDQEQSTEIGEHYYRLIQVYMTIDFSQAGDVILALSNFDAKTSIVNDYVYQLTQKDPLAALYWSDNLVETALRNSAQQQVFKTWVETNPKEALDYLSTFTEIDDSQQDEIISLAANKLSSKGYNQTSQALYQYPAKYQAKIAYSVVTHWPESKLEQAVNWINTLDHGATKDLAIKSYVDYTGISQYVPSTFELIKSVEDHNLQISLTKRTFTAWYQQSPTEALNVLNELNYLSTEQKNQFADTAQNIISSPNYR